MDISEFLNEEDLASATPTLDTSKRFWAFVDKAREGIPQLAADYDEEWNWLPIATLEDHVGEYGPDELLMFVIIHAFLSDNLEIRHGGAAADRFGHSDSAMYVLARQIVSAGHAYYSTVYHDEEQMDEWVEDSVGVRNVASHILQAKYGIDAHETPEYAELWDNFL